MGQLIKLQDYVSRYEQNIFHYPSRFVMLKKQQWEKWQYDWETGIDLQHILAARNQELEGEAERTLPLLTKIKTMFKKKNSPEIQSEMDLIQDFGLEENEEINVRPTYFQRTHSIEELKKQFLNHLFDFQMKWATSTIGEKSSLNKKFYFDEKLKYFLQRFPDTYLIMYQPIFKLKNAPVEVEYVLLSPTDVWCITFLEDQEDSVFLGSKEKFWTVQNSRSEKKILNPIIALYRTGNIVRSILKYHGIEMPIHQIILSRNGYIDYPTPPFDVEIVEKRNYDEWFRTLRHLRSPLKSVQLKGAKALLEFCQTNSRRRPEWEEYNQNEI